MDSLTPVRGDHVRMLRLLARDMPCQAECAGGVYKTSPHGCAASTADFLEQWFAAEAKEEHLWPSFRAAADFHVDTALPYDLHVLKVRTVYYTFSM